MGIGLVIALMAFGCGGPGFSMLKKGSRTLLTGDIDAVERTEVVYDDDKKLSVTLVGISTGEGITLVGLQPGLAKGKKVKIDAIFFQNIQGTDIFKVISIIPLKPATIPVQDEPLPSPPASPPKPTVPDALSATSTSEIAIP